jgi:gamma-glutamyltranspeptidase / glutathione hydrolase
MSVGDARLEFLLPDSYDQKHAKLIGVMGRSNCGREWPMGTPNMPRGFSTRQCLSATGTASAANEPTTAEMRSARRGGYGRCRHDRRWDNTMVEMPSGGSMPPQRHA